MADSKSILLLETAVDLLRSSEDPEKITTRMIADRAGVNLALINYYYGSKDNLLKSAVGEIMGKSSSDMYGYADEDDPKEKILGFFISISHDMVRYRKYSSLFLPDIIMKDRIELPDFILPAVRSYFGEARSEQYCRMAAYRMVVQAQVIFMRLDDVGRYAGIDFRDEGLVADALRDIVEDTLRRV